MGTVQVVEEIAVEVTESEGMVAMGEAVMAAEVAVEEVVVEVMEAEVMVEAMAGAEEVALLAVSASTAMEVGQEKAVAGNIEDSLHRGARRCTCQPTR